MRERFFNWLAGVAIHRPWTVLLIAAGIFVVSAGVSSLAKPAMGWMDMLPQDEPAVVEFGKILTEFGATEVMTASVEGPDPDELVAFAGQFETRLLEMKDEEGKPLIERVTWREDADYFLDHGLMLAKAKDLQRLIDSGVWDEPGLLSALEAQNRDFKKEYVDDDGGSLEKKEAEATVAIDTMWWLPRTLRSFIEHSEASDDELRAAVELGARRYVSGDLRYFSDDRSILLLLIQPTFSTENMELTLSTVGAMREIFDELIAQYPAIAANYPGPWPGKTLWDTPEVMITPPEKAHMGTGITGWHQYYYDETMTGFNDFGAGMIIAFLLVLALFVVAFRMWTSPLLAMAVLVMSITLATAFMALALGELTMMAMMIPIVLLGLGVDYAIHIVGEFTKRRHQGESVNDAMAASLQSTGKGILTGGLTTAVAFLALGFTSFRGLSDFGIGAGGGVLATLLTSFIVLPAALVVIHRRKEKKAAAKEAKTGVEGSAGFFLDFAALRVTGTMAYRAWPLTILVVALVTIYMGMRAGEVKWAKDMLSVEAKGLASLTLNKVLEERFYIHPDADLLSAGSLDEAYELTEELEDVSTVRLVQSVTSLVPPESKQRLRAPLVTAIGEKIGSWAAPPEFDADSAAAFGAALKQMDCNVITIGKSAFMSGMDRLYDKSKLLVPEGATCVERTAGQPRPEGGWPRVAASEDVKAIAGWLEANPTEAPALLNRFQAIFEPAFRATLKRVANPATVTLDMLSDAQRGRFLSKDGKRFLITVNPRGDVWNEDFQNEHIPKMTAVSERVTGTVMLFVATIERGAQEGRKATYLCFAVILVLLLLDFVGLRGRHQVGRGLLAGGLAIVPLIIAAIWMVGFMAIAGIDVNMANIIALPLILGIGIDDGVHVVHRYIYEEEGSDRIPRVLGTTGRAILLTSLTTIAAFGSFAFGLYQGMVTMGIILAVGIAFCFVLSAYLLPALIRVVELLGVKL